MLIWTALIMGLVGNLHCLGMCGPIALAVPIKKSTTLSKLFSILLYNGGRLFIYSIFGAVFGLFGEGIVLAGFQRYLSLILGATIILAVLFPFLTKKANLFNAPIFGFVARLKASFHKHFSSRTYRSIFIIGLLNGLLPCGLVYMAVAGAIAAGTWQMGMLYMFVFGLGTLPAMMLLPYFGQFINGKIRSRFIKLIPITMFLFGVLLLLRGSNLGIPYLSPKIEVANASCCSKMKCH